MEEIKRAAEGIFYKIAFSILIVMIGFFLAQYVLKLNEIQREIAKLQIEVGKIQVQMLDREQVQAMIIDYHVNHPYYKGDK